MLSLTAQPKCATIRALSAKEDDETDQSGLINRSTFPRSPGTLTIVHRQPVGRRRRQPSQTRAAHAPWAARGAHAACQSRT